ncbi:stage III sporulation protein AH [Oceanobacillus arenosus]|uniref:Stage III sporulation protein AH n=1 Tax=Oceanobacillus arenosus TaxID=1229153 RepID=A0A3D8PV52_9BACI|nr:SpoIIIAH-like family protein [Oceanobacillus arenosus]RDW19158.1 stage III sporulation protein AH [Oceanobacillus arenosus]
MLKKQTVWLLTMLSLMIVLSVYYILGGNNNDNLAFINDGQSDQNQSVPTDSEATDSEGNAKVTGVESSSQDEIFTSIRMKVTENRDMKLERLNDVLAASSSSVSEKNEAKEEIDKIGTIETKEKILEETILNNAEYDDVLVRVDNDKVHVQVLVDQLSATEADNIMQLVRDEFGDEVTTDVNFQPSIEKE